MTIALVSMLIRHERRIRLFFSNTLAAGAFTTLTYYTVQSQDGAGPDPNVIAAYPLTGNPGGVELALDNDLVDTGLYQVAAIGVPATDTSVTGADSTKLTRIGFGVLSANVEAAARTSDRDQLMYFVDLAWNGDDLVENAQGDLATTTGQANALNAVVRRLMGEPLLWDANYSPRSRERVGAPGVTLDGYRAELVRQALLDPRMRDASASIQAPLDAVGESPVVAITLTPIGGKPQLKKLPNQPQSLT